MQHRILLCVCALATAVTPAAAQTFEGVITMQTTAMGAPSDLTLHVKGGLLRIDGLHAGTTMIRDAKGRMLMVQASEKSYFVMPLRLTSDDLTPTFTPTGKDDTVLGYNCSYYRVHFATAANDDEACVTTAFGFVGIGRYASLDERVLRKTFGSGFMVLKSVDRNGKPLSVVKKVERTTVSDDDFAPPPGFSEVKMPGTGGFAPSRKP
ncbi:MAG: DUF4412 domain-containing protein [Gemmatimonadaceae bacterium]